jgi:hypothetical protein
MIANEPESTIKTPSSCPACGSTDLTAVGKVVAETTYWRCCTCGEVWNPERRRVHPQLSRW